MRFKIKVMKSFFYCLCLATVINAPAQNVGIGTSTPLNRLSVSGNTDISGNVGIGTTTPTGPLSFASSIGNKIVLYGDGNTGHYGFGIQGGLLQMYTDAAAANISFGYGRSGAFTERARIINQGEYGMTLRGRLQLQTGTQSAGLWLTNMANTINAAFIGMASDNQVGFFGGTGAQWGLTMNTTSGNVGIGNNAPNVPLAFAPALGKKITLYPGATGDVGFGVAGNRLQIYSDNPNADVAIGYDAAGVFNERFAVKPTGALAVVGNTGNPGQLLMSNGGGAAAVWSNKPSLLVFNQSSNVKIAGVLQEAVIPGMDGQQFTITQNSRVVFTTTLFLNTNPFGSPETETYVEIKNASNARVGYADNYFQFHDFPGQRVTANGVTVLLTPGTYTIFVKIYRTNTIDGELNAWTAGGCVCQGGQLIMQVVPE